MHRDIKPSNVLISKEGDVKIIDFDLADFLNPTTRYQYAVATRGFKPPEIQLYQTDYDYRFDTYSAGALMASILFQSSNYFGFMKEEEAWHCTTLKRGVKALKAIDKLDAIDDDYVVENKHIEAVPIFDEWKEMALVDKSEFPKYEEAFDLLEKLLALDYTERPMAIDALKHPFFEGVGKKS